MNIDNLELTMDEIYELVFRNHKDEYRSYSLNHFGKTLKERVLEIKPSGRDFFGNYVWNCNDLISYDIASREEIELYVREKLKFMQAAFDDFECFRDVEDEEDNAECASEQASWLEGK